MASAEIEELFSRTLAGEYEAEKAWAAVNELRRDGSREIFERAAAWCGSGDARERSRAAAILCQLRRAPVTDDEKLQPVWLFRDESYPLITKMLENEQDAEVLDSAISALGHLDNPQAIPLILDFLNHPDAEIRFATTFALGQFPSDPQSVEGLLKLTMDADKDVRDWAVFGLGVLGDADSPEIREALLRCLHDEDEDVREEAAVGLGKRRDANLLPELRAMLEGSELHCRVAEAAAALLEVDEEPPGWTSADYRAALEDKFGLAQRGEL